MKLLRIGILNLNSLRGYQTIDFTTSPLADHQLYAIVGPTGAGKTTILDAITLALYGQTERNKAEKDRKDGSGSVMTYGEGECSAEVEYQTAQGRFKNVWQRQRAHKKADRDLTASRREISRWNDEKEDWDILATKKKEVDEQTEAIVGLDYERFVRSVMLTQGDFARFLKSKPGEKAAILENITGTAIYRDLSIAAFERAKLAREAHGRAAESLASSPPLLPEDRQQLEARAAQQKAEVKPLKKQLAEVAQQLNDYTTQRSLHTKTEAAAAELLLLEKEWKNAVAERQALAANDALQPLRTDLEAEQRLTRSQQHLTTAFNATELAGGDLTEKLKKARAATTAVQDKLNDYYEKLPGREKKFAAVAELEREISVLRRDAELDNKRLWSLHESSRAQQEKIQQLQGQKKQIEQTLAGLNPSALQASLSEVDKRIPQLNDELEGLSQRLQQRQLQDRLSEAQKNLTATRQELDALAPSTTAAEQAFAAADQALADRRLVMNNLRLSASLSEHKTNLLPGEACPVCGATEHPALEDFEPVTESALERTQRDVNHALQQKEEAKKLLERLQQQAARLQRVFDQQQGLTSELSQQIGNDSPAEKTTTEELERQRSALTHTRDAATKEQLRLRALQANLPRLTAIETELAVTNKRQAELAEELRTAEQTIDKATKLVEKKKESIRKAVGDRTAEECREMTRQQKEKLNAQLAGAEKTELDLKGQQATIDAKLKDLRERLTDVRQEADTVSARLTEALSPQGLTVIAAREQLLSEATARELRKRLQQLSTRRATAETVHKNFQAELAEAKKKLEQLPTQEALEQLHTEREFAVSEADRLVGALELQIRQDDERIAAVAAQKEALEGLRKEADRWQRLNDLIGSADGKKFRSYAQSITLQQLIAIGNDHLASINPRYRMEYEPPTPGSPERLEMIIIDTYQNDNRRTMATLSGGESFLISLALALGLSDLASGKSLIQSLFIDEGFGTLDGKTLDQAMTTLEQLQAQGKTIGLISHVPQLRERIYCQLQLERVGDGFSRVVVRG